MNTARRLSDGDTSQFYLAIAQLLCIFAAILSFCALILPCWVTVTTSKHANNYGLFIACRDWKNCTSDFNDLYMGEAGSK